MIVRATWWNLARSEFLIAGAALIALVIGQSKLAATIHGTHYAGADGKMLEAITRTAFRLTRVLDVTSLSLIQGAGSQALPLNVWANPAYWPFALIAGERAADVSGLIALACFAAATYIMARCFDLSPLASAIAAQSSIYLFGVHALLNGFATVFVAGPGLAVVYAQFMLALGLLARIEAAQPARWLRLTAALIFLLLYALYCDPLWSMIGGISWAVAFAAVTLAPLQWRTILARGAALACCALVLAASGAAEYLYSLSQYTSRVQFPTLSPRPPAIGYASMLFTSPDATSYYGACLIGWALGLVACAGRPRVLVVAGVASFACLAGYAAAYVAIQADWWLPLPIYVEHCLYPLFATAAAAGYWGAAAHVGAFLSHLAGRAWAGARGAQPQPLDVIPRALSDGLASSS